MPVHPLEGARLQVTRAKQYFDALKAEVDAWLEDNPYPASEEIDAETGEKLLCIGDEIPVPPPGWGLIVNDIGNGNGSRSALEYTVAEISIKFGGDPKRDKVTFLSPLIGMGIGSPEGQRGGAPATGTPR